MILNELKPRKALNKAFLKIKPSRIEIENFKANLVALLDRTNDTESEEFHKNLVSDFLKDTYYKQNHFINTKGRNDLVIHNGNTAKSSVGVIIEAKKPTNKTEMTTTKKLNTKAFQELVLYYLRERITHKNLEIKHLVATNINEWFIFDATLFDRLFAQNKNFAKQFNDFEGGRLADTKTDFFYKQIAEPFIAEITTEIEFTYFNIQDYQTVLRNNDKADDNSLIALFKLLSPEHLLKLPFANDSNNLDKQFYSELLHIIGLTEIKDGGKKLIERNKEGERHSGTLLEDAIIQLESLDKLNQLKNPTQFGNTKEEQLFNVAIELSITWINRILFLKLLEAQLISYHKSDSRSAAQRNAAHTYSFLNLEKIKDYDDLNGLFFQVLARKHQDRNSNVKNIFEKVPYLNSSLFEPTEIEQVTLFISNLKSNTQIPILSSTVLKNKQGKKKTGNLNTLEYLFEFLDAYDFGSEGSEEIQEDNKTLINASVLGLIFEKINGYKDGSFFTPGFITMYMCRETIQKAVIQKFNKAKKWNCNDFSELKEDVKDYIKNNNKGRKEARKNANEIVNSITICDPAVGSGHFLVSALNEIISIKSELSILCDKTFEPINDYSIFVENDELIITNLDDKLFEYIPTNKESQRIQETLFHEKQTIIENCLFGVDINPNSVKICRLRLWIELLKNAYYKTYKVSENFIGLDGVGGQLETLPNIDINIKCGNSLVSRFAMDADLSQALKKSKGKWSIDMYRIAVATYRNAQNKEEKREMERLILEIKQSFATEIRMGDPLKKRLDKIASELYHRFTGTFLFEPEAPYGKEEKNLEKERKVEQQKLEKEIEQLNGKIEAIKTNKIFENAFEWRFEFPEVLNDEGDFMGFDVVIGNPPYIQLQAMKEVSEQLKRFEYLTYEKMGDIYSLFYEKGNQILKNNGYLAYITSNKWMRAGYGRTTRNYFLEYTQPQLLIDLGSGVFEEATVDSNILIFKKQAYQNPFKALDISKEKNISNLDNFTKDAFYIDPKNDESWTIANSINTNINAKIERIGKPLKDWDVQINYGIKTGYNEAFIIDGKKKDELIAQDPQSAEIIKPILRGRDVKRYKAEFADLWLIATFPALKIDIEKYPAVKKYLESFGKRLHQTGETFIDKNGEKVISRKKTGNKWFETQDQIGYYKDFEKEKIVWKRIGSIIRFQLDSLGNLCLDSTCFLTGNNIKFLIAYLNSKVAIKQLLENSPKTGTGDVITSVQALEPILIPNLSALEQQPFIKLVEKILTKKEKGNDTTDLETQIDQLVYKLYNLNADEIKIIENA